MSGFIDVKKDLNFFHTWTKKIWCPPKISENNLIAPQNFGKKFDGPPKFRKKIWWPPKISEKNLMAPQMSIASKNHRILACESALVVFVRSKLIFHTKKTLYQ